MNKLKNIIVVNDFDYIQGGASKVAIDTANLLSESEEKFNVYFFSGNSNDKNTLNENVIKISTNQIESLKDKNKFRGIINGLYNFKAKNTLKELLKTLDKNETIIHVHGWTKCLSSSIFDIAFKMNFKVVLTLHDYFTACPNGGYFNYNKNEICKLKPMSYKCLKCNCDSRNYIFKLYRIVRHFIQNNIVRLNYKLENVISISEFSENILKETLNKNTKITKIYNPIESDKNKKIIDVTNNKYYLYVGRISKEKGVDIFCQAITELNYEGIVVGDGDEKEKLERKYPNIKFTGWKDKKEVEKYMENARALVFPSRWYEGAPLTIIEAQSIGLPVISSNSCSGIEFVDKKLIFDIKKTEKLKQIIKLLEDNLIVDKISKELYIKYNKGYMELYKNNIIKYLKKLK